MEESGNDLKILTVECMGKRPLGKHGRRWEDNIKTDLLEIGVSTIRPGQGLLENDIQPTGSISHGVG